MAKKKKAKSRNKRIKQSEKQLELLLAAKAQNELSIRESSVSKTSWNFPGWLVALLISGGIAGVFAVEFDIGQLHGHIGGILKLLL